MTAAPQVRSNEIIYNPSGMPIIVNSPVMSLSAAAANQGSFMVPFNASIVQVSFNLFQAPDGSAALIDIGNRTDVDKFLDAFSIPTTHALGYRDITDDAAVVLKDVDQGDIIEFTTDGAATATGLVAFSVAMVARL